MIKINKQVASSKINYFLEINEVVLFFHCNNSVRVNLDADLLAERRRNTNHIHINDSLPSQRDTASFKRGNASGCTQFVVNMCHGEVTHNQDNLETMMVKNRLAEKVFLQISVNKSLHNKDLIIEKQGCSASPLFHGPTLLLGCSSVKMLKKGIDICAKHKGLLLLGALYRDCIINHSQVKRLIANSNSDQGYLKVLCLMRDPILRALRLIRDSVSISMRCLLLQQNRLILVLRVRREQIVNA